MVARVVEARDPFTAGHASRVSHLARSIGEHLGLSASEIDGLRVAGTLHDLGKVAIPTEVLFEPRRLTVEQMALVQTHPREGGLLLREVEFPWPIALVAEQHHERLDGSGYPFGLVGGAISFEARVIAVADVVDAMASDRPYRRSLGIARALEEISDGRGHHFDSDIVAACIAVVESRGLYPAPIGPIAAE